MPYVKQERREKIQRGGIFPNTEVPANIGDLTFVIYQAMVEALPLPEERKYVDFALVLGAVESAKLEFYHKEVRPYEDLCIVKNGDVK